MALFPSPWPNRKRSTRNLIELRLTSTQIELGNVFCEGEDIVSKHLESLYQNLVNGKLPHNLSWSEAVELVGHLGEVQPHGNDEFVFVVGGQRLFFKKPTPHDLGMEEVSRLRKFLKEAGPSANKSGAPK